ncbi:MAG: hypothetical protein NVS3B7_16420 [Candidatus Elarobacter sp.]
MTEGATHDILIATAAICATVIGVALVFARGRARRFRDPAFVPGAMRGTGAQRRRTGLTPRIVFTVLGGAMMIPDLLVPILGEAADLVILVVLGYAWYTYFSPSRPTAPPIAQPKPPGVEECFRCGGTGFVEAKTCGLCAGNGWVPAHHRPD